MIRPVPGEAAPAEAQPRATEPIISRDLAKRNSEGTMAAPRLNPLARAASLALPDSLPFDPPYFDPPYFATVGVLPPGAVIDQSSVLAFAQRNMAAAPFGLTISIPLASAMFAAAVGLMKLLRHIGHAWRAEPADPIDEPVAWARMAKADTTDESAGTMVPVSFASMLAGLLVLAGRSADRKI